MSEIIASLTAAIWADGGLASRFLPEAGGSGAPLYALCIGALLIGWRGARKARRD
ncbi:MAG: hypothetical protein AB7F98_17525 [Novosphingobium sp.]